MRVFNSLKWAALPLALSLAGCSLFSNAVDPSKQVSLLAYVSLQALDQINVVSMIQKNPVPGDNAVSAGRGPANMVMNPKSDKEYLYVANEFANSVSFVNVRTRQLETSVDTAGRPWDVAVTPSGTHLYASNHDEGTVARIEIGKAGRTGLIQVADAAHASFKPRGVAVNPKRTEGFGEVYVTSDQSLPDTTTSSVAIIKDTATTHIPVGQAGSQLWKVSVSLDGNKLFITDRGHAKLWIVDLASNNQVTSIDLKSPAWDVVVHPKETATMVYVSMPAINTVAAVNWTTKEVKETYLNNALPTAAAPQAMAINKQGTELWMALAGSNQLATIPLDPDSMQAAAGPRAVNYTYNPGQSASITDIVLGPGIQ